MTDCRHLDDYLASTLEEQDHDAFEVHLSQCDNCRTAVAQWDNVKQQFAGWVTDHETLPVPTMDDASQFRDALQQRMQDTAARIILRRRQTIIGLALAAGLLFAAGVGFFRSADETAPIDVRTRTAVLSPPMPAPAPAPAGEAPTWEAADRSTTISLESGDRLHFTPGSAATALHLSTGTVSLRLDRGTVVCDVRPRNGEGSFTVAAGPVTVTVTGTRFAVQLENGAVRVAVEKGSVQVARSNGMVTLGAGQSVTVRDGIGAVADSIENDRSLFAGLPAGVDGPSPGAARGKAVLPVVKDMDAWRALILNGQADLADAQMRDWLARHPGDGEVLMLRGNSLRRQSKYEEALQVYEAVIEKGSAENRSTACYLAGDIAGRHLRHHALAIGYFETYLAHAPADAPNRAEAALRLSDALAATGRTADARRRLEDIIATFGRTPVANEARKRLAALP